MSVERKGRVPSKLGLLHRSVVEFGLPHGRGGVVPGVGGCWVLLSLVYVGSDGTGGFVQAIVR